MYKLSGHFDYPSIKKLALALHKFGANKHGAAIMIGAGFSRSAARHVGGEKKMPLWDEFSKKLLTDLNPNENDLIFSDPLRVAEEYRAYFGPAALNDRIRSEIDDEAWRTGDLYQSLLNLPWSEIMTTNWDTLLERAAKDIHSQYYTPVTKFSDFVWTPSPRIVKLHGTIGTTDTFIAAQEDYRTYPEKFAPFVNFVRQVFIENELCLLGFSGDDPNFLNWSGWIRDHLAGHARKIYLVGALNLTAARRKHLESINISPIDLWDAVKDIDDCDLRHQKATELFLQAMKDEGESIVKPHKWSPSYIPPPDSLEEHSRRLIDPNYAKTLLSAHLEKLRKDRESYPGWLVCPPILLEQLKVYGPLFNPINIAALEPDNRTKLLYEIAWRHGVTFASIAPWLEQLLFQVVNLDDQLFISKRHQMEIALVLLKNSRWLETDDEESKNERIKALVAILEKHTQYLPDCTAELAYHKALTARDELDYQGLNEVINKIEGEDPVWKLRQAALLMELGRSGDGERLIIEAYRELQERYRHDQNSIPILSRFAWASWLLKATTQYQNDTAVETPPNIFKGLKDWQCDPWTWIEYIRDRVTDRQEEYIQNQNPIEPLFEQGHYRDNSNAHSTSSDASELLLIEGLSRSVGIPLRSGGAIMKVDLLAGSVGKLVITGGIGIALWNYTLAIRAASSESSPSIKRVFTRIGVANTSQEIVDTLVTRILQAIKYWREKLINVTKDQRIYALSALGVLIEVLSRLTVRMLSEKAKEIFRLGVSLGKEQNLLHHWLFDAIDSLLTNSLKSIPESEQGELLAEALAFPLQSEVMDKDFPRFPNPVINHHNARNFYPPSMGRRIEELIAVVTPEGSVSSTSALLRFIPLLKEEGFLTQTERDKLASALWGNKPDYQALPNLIGLFPHVLLLLPALNTVQVKALVYRHLYEHGREVLTDTQKELRNYPSPEIHRAVMIYAGMANAAANETTRLFPTSEQALALFDRLMVWRPQIEKNDFLGAASNARKQLIESIGNALSYAIVPALSIEAKAIEKFEQLKIFYKEVDGAFFVMPAFVFFAGINEDIATTIEKIIRKALQSSNTREVSYAAIALQKWMELPGEASAPQIQNLISKLIAIIESGRTVGLQQLIRVAGELLNKQLMKEDQVTTLIEAISNVFNTTNYKNIESNSQEAISASSIREACAKLAYKLLQSHPENTALQDLIKESRADALPEVRFAIDTNEP